jgi:hypothetical protein
VGSKELTVAVIRVRCRGDRLRRLPSKPQKLASVKGEEGIKTFPHHEKQDTIRLGQDP